MFIAKEGAVKYFPATVSSICKIAPPTSLQFALLVAHVARAAIWTSYPSLYSYFSTPRLRLLKYPFSVSFYLEMVWNWGKLAYLVEKTINGYFIRQTSPPPFLIQIAALVVAAKTCFFLLSFLVSKINQLLQPTENLQHYVQTSSLAQENKNNVEIKWAISSIHTKRVHICVIAIATNIALAILSPDSSGFHLAETAILGYFLLREFQYRHWVQFNKTFHFTENGRNKKLTFSYKYLMPPYFPKERNEQIGDVQENFYFCSTHPKSKQFIIDAIMEKGEVWRRYAISKTQSAASSSPSFDINRYQVDTIVNRDTLQFRPHCASCNQGPISTLKYKIDLV